MSFGGIWLLTSDAWLVHCQLQLLTVKRYVCVSSQSAPFCKRMQELQIYVLSISTGLEQSDIYFI